MSSSQPYDRDLLYRVFRRYSYLRQEGYSMDFSAKGCGADSRVLKAALNEYVVYWIEQMPSTMSNAQVVRMVWGDHVSSKSVKEKCEMRVASLRRKKEVR